MKLNSRFLILTIIVLGFNSVARAKLYLIEVTTAQPIEMIFNIKEKRIIVDNKYYDLEMETIRKYKLDYYDQMAENFLSEKLESEKIFLGKNAVVVSEKQWDKKSTFVYNGQSLSRFEATYMVLTSVKPEKNPESHLVRYIDVEVEFTSNSDGQKITQELKFDVEPEDLVLRKRGLMGHLFVEIVGDSLDLIRSEIQKIASANGVVTLTSQLEILNWNKKNAEFESSLDMSGISAGGNYLSAMINRHKKFKPVFSSVCIKLFSGI